MQGLHRNVRGMLRSHKNRIAGLYAQLDRERGTQQRVALRERIDADIVKIPEPLVDAIDRNFAGSSFATLNADEALSENHGSDPAGECGIASKIVGKLVSDKTRGQDEVRCLSQPLDNQGSKAATDRVADKQSSGKNGDSHSNTENDGNIRSPVVLEVPQNKLADSHGEVRVSWPPDSSNRTGNCDANLGL